jgi:site-specific DNA recombinase
MKAIGYIRVSSLIQIEGESLAVQKERAKLYANAQGWEYKKTYSDEGISGKSIKGRLELQKLLEDAQNKKFDAVIVRSISRFGRNLVDCVNNNKILADNEIKLISLNENVDFSSTIGQIILSVLAGFAQLDNEQRSEASISSKIKLAKRNISGIGRMPFAATEPQP